MQVTTNGSGLKRAMLKRAAQLVVHQALVGAILLAAAGTWRWPAAWGYLGLTLLLLAGNAAWVQPRNPEVIAERGRRHPGTRRFDKVLLPFYFLVGTLVFVVAGLDARFGWTALPASWAVLGVALMTAGMVPIAGAMGVNRHLEPTVRIQDERGHEVVTSGPYRYVRHPMYAGVAVQTIAAPLLLGSAWALLPAGVVIVLLVVRTAFEDRMLRAELAGYADYARRTRYRLIPGLW